MRPSSSQVSTASQGTCTYPGASGYGVVGELTDLAGRECVTERMIAPVHHQRPLGVDHRAAAEDRLDSPRVGLDEHQVVGQRRGEPAGGILAEGTAPGDKTHFQASDHDVWWRHYEALAMCLAFGSTFAEADLPDPKNGVQWQTHKYGSVTNGVGVKRLNGVDALMLYSETPEIHMHTLKIGVLDVSEVEGGYNFDLFRAVAFPRLKAMAPLRYQLVDIPMKLHHPMWVVNDEIDFDYHVRRIRVPAPGGRRELDQLIGEIASTPLDRSRPLWEMYVAEGLADDRIAIIHKVHHVLADGVASANQMAKAMAPHEPSGVVGTFDEPDIARTRSGPAEGGGPRPRRD